MTSEEPDKYAYCENDNQNFAFLPNAESFWITCDLCLKISLLQRRKKNSKFLKIALSGKAKFKKKKKKKLKNSA